ncbi:MAG: leucyl/phenylalanyl-tRNA--protein transferase [Bacteroidaceae bacterium]|nr:leucyl/phenylalanyl-tRNA--protein transferase [Bacteroidaceae bacterium]
MVFRLDDNDVRFPNPMIYPPNENGAFCIGGKLTPEWLLLAYSHGIFPWFAFKWNDEPIWYCPMDRFVIFPREIHVSHSMRTLMNKDEYTLSYNQCFEDVIHHCSSLRINNEGAWLGEDMVKAYTRLHELGYAMSVETWRGEELIGGLYGVTIGRCFFGESMFSLQPNGSKLALISLANLLSQLEDSIIDCQFETPHLKSMGGRHIPYQQYMDILHQSIKHS